MTLDPAVNYRTSRDYCQLWELAHTAKIICIVNKHFGDSTDRVIASTHAPVTGYDKISVEAYGKDWCRAANFDQFEQQCERWDLEWLVPSIDQVQP